MLEADADINIMDKIRNVASTLATKSGYAGIQEDLLNSSIRIDQINLPGITKLFYDNSLSTSSLLSLSIKWRAERGV